MKNALHLETRTKKVLQELRLLAKIYTENRLKEHILGNANQRTYIVKKYVGNIINYWE